MLSSASASGRTSHSVLQRRKLRHRKGESQCKVTQLVCGVGDLGPKHARDWTLVTPPAALIMNLMPACLERANARAGVDREALGKGTKDEPSFMRMPVGRVQPLLVSTTSKPLSWNVPSA